MENLIFTFGGIFFAFALLPTLFTDHKPSIWTSGITAFILFLFALSYFSIGFYSAAIISLITSTMWYIIAIQTKEQSGKTVKKTAE